LFTTKPVGHGTGLGLTTVQSIVRQCGGIVEVSSTPGCGSEFTIHLPEELQPPEQAVERPFGDVQGGHQRILVVDDDPVLRSVTARMLVNLGYRTLEAADGFEALDRVAEHEGRVDLVVSDVAMPQMGGLELAHRLRREWPKVRVVLTSGYADVDLDEDDALTAHATLPKPFNSASLARIVREVLSVA
jgi:CheY-like chemotaxis protein